jgi:pyridoxamine 5'-phosphate oxidase
MPPEFPGDHPPLHAADLGDDPVAALQAWLQVARETGDEAASAMALATASPAGAPSVRIVLLRTADREGLVFHTHRLSRKAVEMEARPEVALLLHWTRPIHRQVRVEGRAERLEDEFSDAYFLERPAGGLLSAWACPQSQVVSGREELERRWEAARRRFPDDASIPRPREWGGYRVIPECFEFWQGREDRLHDRIRFRRAAGAWVRERLAP